MTGKVEKIEALRKPGQVAEVSKDRRTILDTSFVACRVQKWEDFGISKLCLDMWMRGWSLRPSPISSGISHEMSIGESDSEVNQLLEEARGADPQLS